MWITLAGCPTFAHVFGQYMGYGAVLCQTTAYKICYGQPTTYVTPPQVLCFHIHSWKTSLLRYFCAIVAENDGGETLRIRKRRPRFNAGVYPV